MRKVCFVTNEIYPVRPGGAGNLIYQLAVRLIAEGIQVVFVLDLPRLEYRQFLDHRRSEMASQELCRAYLVEELCRTAPFRRDDFLTRYEWESASYDYALRQLCELEQPDLVEFVDYCGPAYYALCARLAGLAYHQTRLAVRVHGAIQEIDRYSSRRQPNLERLVLYALESASLRLADVVLHPTPSSLSGANGRGDPPCFGEAVYSPPPVSIPVRRAAESGHAHILLYYGRLYPVKGADVFVQAGLQLLGANPGRKLDFYLVGGDSPESPDPKYASYAAYLRSLVPAELQSHFTFTGFLDAQALQKVLPDVLAAVFPSRYESFCLAAHELRLAGIPLLLADLPAFQDHFLAEQDALYFNAGAPGLAAQAQRLLDDPDLRQRLGLKPQLDSIGDPLAFYRQEHISSWMEPAVELEPASLLVLILDEENNLENWQSSQRALAACSGSDISILHLIPADVGVPNSGRLLEKSWQVLDETGAVQPWDTILAQDSVMIIRAGGIPSANALQTGLQTLKNQPRVAGVAGWKITGNQLSTRPLALVPQIDLLPPGRPPLNLMLRTESGSPLFEQFGDKAGILTEAIQLWNLEDHGLIGLQLPEALLEVREERTPASHPGDQLINQLEAMINQLSAHHQELLQPWLEWFRLPGATLQPAQRRWSARLVDRLSRGGMASRRLLSWLRQVRQWGRE